MAETGYSTMDSDSASNSSSSSAAFMATPASTPGPLDSLALDVKGGAYNDGIALRSPCQMLKVSTLKELDYNERMMYRSKDNQLIMPSVLPRTQELPHEIESSNSAIWVGMKLSLLPWYKETIRLGHQSFLGHSTDEMHVINSDPRAMRVVCRKSGNTVDFFALIHQDPESKLCSGMKIRMDEVYFFPEFRDDECTSEEDRQFTWKKIIREALERASRAKLLAMETEAEFRNETKTLVELKSMMKRARPDLKPFADKHIHLCRFVDNPNVASLQLCKMALKDIEILWPDVARQLNVELVQRISQCLHYGAVYLTGPRIRAFLVGCYQGISDRAEGGEKGGEGGPMVNASIGKKAMKYARLTVG